MKLSVVISVHNQVPLASACYKEMRANSAGFGIEFIVIDNASKKPLTVADFPDATIIRNEKNIGVYPTFNQGMIQARGEIVAFFHSDVFVWEKHWDTIVKSYFVTNENLGLLGFVGSDEIDWHGGRGGGTASNFMGRKTTDEHGNTWQGSPAEAHGKRLTGYQRGAVVDGCVMIIRRIAWEKIGYRKNFGLHHFYDKLISSQMLEAGFHVGILGVEFDHISGQTVNQESGYHDTIQEWAEKNGIPKHAGGWDATVYNYSEAMWLNEYRDVKHLIPIKING